MRLKMVEEKRKRNFWKLIAFGLLVFVILDYAYGTTCTIKKTYVLPTEIMLNMSGKDEFSGLGYPFDVKFPEKITPYNITIKFDCVGDEYALVPDLPTHANITIEFPFKVTQTRELEDVRRAKVGECLRNLI